MYLLQFPKIMKFQKMLQTRIQNAVQKVYIVTHGSYDILNYHYEIFIYDLYVKFTCLCTRFIHCINNI